MKRIIRLTESDLTRIVRRVMNEAVEGARQSVGFAPYPNQKYFQRLPQGGYKLMLYGNAAGTEPGYWKAGEKVTFGFFIGRTTASGGVLSGNFIFDDKTMSGAIDNGTVVGIDDTATKRLEACNMGREVDRGKKFDEFKKQTGVDFCGYPQNMTMTITLPSIQGKGGVKLGVIDFSGSQVIPIDPVTKTRINSIDVYMPGGSFWGVGGKAAAPAKTSVPAKKP
jgi:hypothetical protein